jgi:hypothetical protein
MNESLNEKIEEIRKGIERGDEKARKEFWRLVGKIKRGEISLTAANIEEISGIRDRLFGRRVVLSVRAGSIIFPAGFLLSLLIFIWSNLLRENAYTFLYIIFSELSAIYFGFLTGRLLGGVVSGIGFEGFYRYSPLEFGVKVSYPAYLRASQKRRVMLYATTFFFQGMVMVGLVAIAYALNPQVILIPLGFLLLWLIGSIAIHYIAKTGEFHRLLRELRIAMEGASVKRKG